MKSIWPTLAIIFSAVICGTRCQKLPCNYFASAELENDEYFGHKFYENETFTTNTGQKRACVCLNGRRCIRKCCPFGLYYDIKTRNCTEPPSNYYLDPLSSLGDGEKYMFLIGKMLCSQNNDEIRLLIYPAAKNFSLHEDGKLYVKIDSAAKALTYDASKYCIDTFVTDNQEPHLNALICFVEQPEHNNYTMSASCMLISCFFILLTVAVYAWLPELRNLHGMVLMAYLLSFFVGFLFLATMQILILLREITEDICIVLTFIVYFSLLSAFFWLNVMCYDIWWTFSGKRAHGRSGSQNKRFLCYAIYAFGVPTLLTVFMAALEFSNIPDSPLLPKLRLQGCFLYGNSKLLYLYGPIVVLCVANLIFFALTAFKIAKIKKETKMLRGTESSTTNDQNAKDTQRFTLYVKLFTVMGINWILEVISSFYPEADVFWQFSDAYNVLVGLIIFIIFVCKKKTWMMIKKRYRQLRGDTSKSGTQTTSSSTRTHSTSRDDMHMHSIKK